MPTRTEKFKRLSNQELDKSFILYYTIRLKRVVFSHNHIEVSRNFLRVFFFDDQVLNWRCGLTFLS